MCPDDALGIAAAGGQVIGVDRDVKHLQALHNIEPYELDLLDRPGQSKLFNHAIDKYGKVDMLINNAGVFERERWQYFNTRLKSICSTRS